MLLSTESFIAFEAVNSTDDTNTTANNNQRSAVAANLARAGYQVSMPSAATTGFAVRPDAINPERNALFLSLGAFTNGIVAAGIRKILPVVNEVVVGGFSLFIPPEFVKMGATTTKIIRFLATSASDAAWDSAIGQPTNEIFRITADLLIKWYTDAAQSSKALTPGRMNYIEYRISGDDVRVWIDDTLVLQKANVPLNTESIAIVVEQNTLTAPGTNLTGAAGRWSFGNWYNLCEDAVTPNVRLGATTRVIGKRPDADVSTQFTRPSGFASNAAVAGQNLVDNPTYTLQSLNVGDQDVYSTTDNTTSTAKLVHAVVTKTLVANLESNPHALRPVIRSKNGVEISTPRAREWRVQTSFSGRDLKGIARRPTDSKIFAVGASISLYSNSQNAAAGSAWVQIADDGGAVSNNAIAFRTDGYGVIGRSDGKLGVLTPGSDNPVIITPASNASAINHVAVLPNGRFIAVGAAGTILMTTAGAAPELAASWTKVTPLAQNMMASAFAPTIGAQGRLMVMSNVNTAATTTNTYVTSDDGGATWTVRTCGTLAVGNTYRTLTWDGNAFVTHASLGTASRRSSDGLTWAALANQTWGTQNNPNNTVNFGFVDPDSSLQLSMCAAGNIHISRDANNFHLLRTAATVDLRSACKTTNGDFLVVGDAGTFMTYSAPAADVTLGPLSGYQTTVNIAPFDTTTSAPWAPSDAAAAQFGMRVIS
jgi:hypothetical protein